VCELDIIFGMQAAYAILDELLLEGELQESGRKAVVKAVRRMDEIVVDEVREELNRALKASGII